MLLLVAAGASALTFTFDTQISGDAVGVVVVLSDAPEGDAVDVSVSLAPGAGDLLGLFGNVVDEGLVPQMEVDDPSGIITQWQFQANQVWKVGGGNNVSPVKHWDFGVRIGEQGSAGGAVESASFRLTAPGLTVAQLVGAANEGWRLGVRIQGTAGAEGGSKLGLPETQQPDDEPPTIQIDSPVDGALVGASPIVVSGTVSGTDPAVDVNGTFATVTGGVFSASFPLVEGSNTLVATATNGVGTDSDSVDVVLDTIPPLVTIDSPAEGDTVFDAEVTVSGTVSDAGAVAAFSINGQSVTLAGGAFSTLVALELGANMITATATDAAGNSGAATVTITRANPQVCVPGSMTSCYEGPGGTAGIGACASGTRTCLPDGSGFGPCEGQSLPGTESCNGLDDDCDGEADEGFGVGNSCSTGAAGICGAGFLACGPSGPVCELATGPQLEVCGDGIDQDCDGSDCVLLLLRIDSPTAGVVTADSTIEVSGTVGAGVLTVDVAGVPASVVGGAFSATVDLDGGPNTIVAIAQDGAGNTSMATVVVMRDTFPPVVRIDSPTDGASVVADRVTVTGVLNDPVTDGLEAVVTVNGIVASVENSAFMAVDVPLAPGPNLISATATDEVGNQALDQIQVERRLPAGPHVVAVSGNGQVAPAGTALAEGLVARVLDAAGNPLVGRPVVFEVTRNNGVLATLDGDLARRVIVATDATGSATAFLQLGDRSGEGNSRVKATAVGATGEAAFTASGLAGALDRLVASMGETQRGAAGSPLPDPFVVRALDDRGNPVAGVPVTFTVVAGGGAVEGLPEVIVPTGADGRVSVGVELGPGEGINNNEVEATVSGTTLSARLRASGLLPGDAAETSVAGVVLDNADTPIPNATVSIDGTAIEGATDAQGQFRLESVPVGWIGLAVDPTTTSRPEIFPHLHFLMLTIPGRENHLVTGPIRIPALAGGGAVAGGASDVTIAMPGVEGVELTVFAGSATFADGSSTGVVSIDQVHFDKVPMPPPDGSVFSPAWTVQPAGTHFDPPAQVQLPNTTGAEPGTIVDMVSFDHGVNRFVSIGPGSVSEDGSVVVSDPGFGITEAGWGGFLPTPPPGTVGDGCSCDEATKKMCDFANSQPDEDPTKLFSQLQCCIAEKVCEEAANGGFDQTDWAESVVPKFIEPLLDPNNADWNVQRQICALTISTQGLEEKICAASMAAYHIDTDLSNALSHPDVGCGTTDDWDKVGSFVEMCQSQLLGTVSAAIARTVSQSLRSSLRMRCLVQNSGRTGPVPPEAPEP